MYTAYIHTATTARNIDLAAIQSYKIPSIILMEHAAIESVKIIKTLIQKEDTICILCGPGNNGADGLAIARLLKQDDYNVYCLVPEVKKMTEEEKLQFEIIKTMKIPYSMDLETYNYDIYIDCLFGNGLSRDIIGKYAQIINAVNDTHKFIISIDMPSGIEATMGNVCGCAIQANHTISLDCFKQGQWLNDGINHCGTLHLVDIGIPKELHQHCMDSTKVITEELIQLPQRPLNAHKGSFGKALMIGGSQNMHGAIHMAASACYHSGIGTLTVMAPDCIGDILAIKDDFYMLLRTPSHDGCFDRKAIEVLKSNIDHYTVVTIGNGMQKNNVSNQLVQQVLKSDKTVILDADSFGVIHKNIDLLKREATTVLTPHIKEMSDLTGIPISVILENPIDVARNFTKEYPHCVLILKSSVTYIAYNKEVYVLNAQNPSLAKGGSGDILCGIMTGMQGQCKDPLQAALSACYVHSQSAILDKDSASVMPDDIINNIGNAIKKLRK